MAAPSPPPDRRRFRRFPAPILVRPAGALSRGVPRRVTDIGEGGLRVLSDEPRKIGERLEVELLFPEGGSAEALVEVAWLEPLPEGAPARFEAGLRFLVARRDDLDRIAQHLEGG